MKFYDAGVIAMIIIVSICVIGGMISGYVWRQDNPIEEAAEEIIKEETGLTVDLTPTSPEK